MKKTIISLLAVLLVMGVFTSIAHAKSTEVTTFDDFIQAVQNASDGDTIIVSGVILINSDCNIGSDSKTVTIERSGTGRIQVESTAVFKNLVFNGKGISADSPFIEANASASFYDCTFKNCNGGAIAFGDYGSDIERCTFLDNSAENGAHIRVKGGMGMNSLYITNSTFTGGHAVNGGAIFIAENGLGVIMQNNTFTKNSATAQGGAIWNCSNLEIDDMSMIYGNTASNGSDIYNYDAIFKLGGSFQNTSAHFASEGITIHGWINEATGRDVNVPSIIQPKTSLKMVFEAPPSSGGETEQGETEPTPPTEEGSEDQKGTEENQQGAEQGESETDDQEREQPDTGTKTEDPEQNDPADGGIEEGDQKENDPSQDTETVAPPAITEEVDDSGTQEAPNNNNEGTDTGTTVAPENEVSEDPSTSMEEAPKQPASDSGITVKVEADTDSGQDSTQDIRNTDLGDGIQNIPVTVTVQAGQPQQAEGESVNMNVNEQPVTLPDGSGTVTINIYVESPKDQLESSQAVKSEPILTETSQPVTQSGVNALQIIQTVLLACILGFLLGDRRSRKKTVDSQEEMK